MTTDASMYIYIYIYISIYIYIYIYIMSANKCHAACYAKVHALIDGKATVGDCCH